MFITLSKSYLILNESDLKEGDGTHCLVFNLKDDNTEPVVIEWPPTIVNSDAGDEKAKKPQANRIVCGCVSPSEDYIALCDDGKNLVVFNRQLEPIRSFVVKRATSKILFRNDEKAILSCDKSGDVYEYDFSDSESSENTDKLLLGHCSMLLDFTMTADSRLIIR